VFTPFLSSIKGLLFSVYKFGRRLARRPSAGRERACLGWLSWQREAGWPCDLQRAAGERRPVVGRMGVECDVQRAGERQMLDLVYGFGIVAFFALIATLALGCARLQQRK
jgi:hypothetical protein